MSQRKTSIEVAPADVITLLKTGYSRWKKDDQGFGSIQEKYGLTFSEMKELFEHKDLKGIKRKVSRLKIVEKAVPTTAPATVVEAAPQPEVKKEVSIFE